MSDVMRTDIERAASKMASRFGAKREIKKLPEYLWEEETVVRMSSGSYGGGMGLLVQTNERLLFIKDGMMNQTTEDFPYNKISSIQWSSGMVTGTITVFVSGNKAIMTNVDKAGGKEMVDEIRARIAELMHSQVTTPATAVEPKANVVDQLKQLGELRDLGILTSEEFDAKKAELLTRL